MVAFSRDSIACEVIIRVVGFKMPPPCISGGQGRVLLGLEREVVVLRR